MCLVSVQAPPSHAVGLMPALPGLWFSEPAVVSDQRTPLSSQLMQPTAYWNPRLKVTVLKQPTNVWGGEGEWKNKLFISGDLKKKFFLKLDIWQHFSWKHDRRCIFLLIPMHQLKIGNALINWFPPTSQEKENSKNSRIKIDSATITWFCNIQYLESQHKNGTKEGKAHDDSWMTCWIFLEVPSVACLELTNNFENILWCITKYL